MTVDMLEGLEGDNDIDAVGGQRYLVAAALLEGQVLSLIMGVGIIYSLLRDVDTGHLSGFLR